MNKFMKLSAVLAILALTAITGYAHATVQPKESIAGANEKYTMRVPTEKFVPTVRIEVEFPATLTVSSVDSKPGWKIDERKDGSGKIAGVVLTGVIPTGESALFTFSAQNPDQEGKLTWKVIQIYQDDSRSEWTGPPGSRMPAPVVEVKK